ncbi:uncharacterized protein LDX57_011968 [Aspergillus melleus]|uniref:uncharacterized protein n=1 Tax=Aspergillus melleus TaxID=138277 RepID=UPI001E8D0D2F|nr:uncharacterized protein LDX57_011968 [Aspergillus melleus]KAH8434321.1 hypothetical protein LDX57_011968 [Aspergillus melleus]
MLVGVPFSLGGFASGALIASLILVGVTADSSPFAPPSDSGSGSSPFAPPSGSGSSPFAPPSGTGSGSVCPSTWSTTPNGSPEITTTFNCPTDDGKLYATSSGDYMYIQCCTDRNNGLLLGVDNVADFGACMDLCMKDQTGKCRSVSFTDATTGRSDPFNCALYAHGGFAPDESLQEAHHAYFVEAPYQDQPDDEIELCSTKCPGAHNQVFTSNYGETFLMVCGKRHGSPGVSQFVDSYEQCIDTCGLIGQCKSVDYHHRTGSCTFGDHGGEPMIDAPGYASAWSMGCSGACKTYPKPPAPADEKHCPGPGGYHLGNWLVDGMPWLTRCSTYYYDDKKNGGAYVLDTAAASVEDCMKKCQDDDPRCVWGSFNFASGECTGYPTRWNSIDVATDGKVAKHVNFGRLPTGPGMAPVP